MAKANYVLNKTIYIGGKRVSNQTCNHIMHPHDSLLILLVVNSLIQSYCQPLWYVPCCVPEAVWLCKAHPLRGLFLVLISNLLCNPTAWFSEEQTSRIFFPRIICNECVGAPEHEQAVASTSFPALRNPGQGSLWPVCAQKSIICHLNAKYICTVYPVHLNIAYSLPIHN